MNPWLQNLRQWLRTQWQRWIERLADTPQPPPAPTKLVAPQTFAQLPAPLLPCVTVAIPALNEEKRIAQVVAYALSDSATAEVIVVDDCSVDQTAALASQAGATVISSVMLGKGASMADAVRAAGHEIVVFLDGDLAGLRPGIISDLVRPLIKGEAEFVKARFGRGGGRVTELTAKPMLKVFFPELARFSQPLGGVIAARRSLLAQMEMEDGYGVDIGLLIDVWRSGAKMLEVDIGHLEHDSQPLLDLTAMANEVSRVIYSRAKDAGRLHVEQITAMYETQRQATASWEYVMTRQRGRRKLLLLDMDGTVTTERFAVQLAQVTGNASALAQLMDPASANPDAATRSNAIAALFRFVHRKQFERVAKALALRPGVIETIKALRRAGFMVGLVSDSYFAAADIVRKRIYADFAIAHTLQFQNDVCTGELLLNPAFSPRDEAQQDGSFDKAHVVDRFQHTHARPAFECIWAVGDNQNDMGMLQKADKGFAIDPKAPTLHTLKGVQVIHHFHELLGALSA
jgi:glucosyl-3-phosphoglycerate synthase